MANWNERYLQNDTPWDRGGSSPALAAWMSETEPCRVLVPGCGRGHEVLTLARQNYAVVGLDIAPRALELLEGSLQEEGLSAELICADLLQWSPKNKFQAVYEQTCFCALPPEQWPTYAQQLRKWLEPGGQLAASFMQTGQEGGPPYHCDLETMREHLDPKYWIWPESSPQRYPHPKGELYELTALLIRR